MEHQFKYKLKKIVIRNCMNRLAEMYWDNPPSAPPHSN